MGWSTVLLFFGFFRNIYLIGFSKNVLWERVKKYIFYMKKCKNFVCSDFFYLNNYKKND
jgi:hypothetical protein